MNISKTRFINWTRCPMYFPMDLKLNPTGKADIDDERERREERLAELREGVKSSDGFDAEDEEFDAQPGPELEALLPYYNKVEEEALKVARSIFVVLSLPTQRIFMDRNSSNTNSTDTLTAATWISTTRTKRRSTSSR